MNNVNHNQPIAQTAGAYETVSAIIAPIDQLNILSKVEVAKLLDSSQSGLYKLFRSCALAVLNTGNDTDNGKELLERYKDFDISIVQEERGIKLAVKNAPGNAFVDGKMIRGISEHLFTVLRDVIYNNDELSRNPKFNVGTSEGITDAVFHMLRNANLMKPGLDPNLVVCWGGHSINRIEYDYTKEVGYQLGLRGLDNCTGCGPGAMKGPMKGATIGHAKQRITTGRYIGITEPGIIAAEAPNPIVNQLTIMPDIEKRLEAFVRLGHGIIVFPGGAGTAEEILYILGLLLHPDNKNIPFPLIFTGPETSAEYFARIDKFIGDTLGAEAQAHYKIIVNDPATVAQEMKDGIRKVREFRKHSDDAYYFNWQLKISPDLQQTFVPSHENMRNLELHKNQPVNQLAANLRRAFSGIVAGNVKEEGILAIEKHGHFELHGDYEIMHPVDELLESFARQSRMKLPGREYIPCYKVIK
jgi:predicted Rossmann-fold nucleotide-binding protein